jgi:hypothetical protein
MVQAREPRPKRFKSHEAAGFQRLFHCLNHGEEVGKTAFPLLDIVGALC